MYIAVEFTLLCVLTLVMIVLMLSAEDILNGTKKGDDFMQLLSNKWFDILKWCSIVALPAISTFIVVISKIWGWADLGSMVAQTITAVAVLLGALLGISHIQYKNGDNNADN